MHLGTGGDTRFYILNLQPIRDNAHAQKRAPIVPEVSR